MNRPKAFLHIFLVCFLFIYACKTKRVIIDGKREKINNLNSHKLIDSILSKKLTFQYFTSKLSVEANLPNDSKSFKATLRIRKDSVIWLYLMKLNIPVASVSITKDSIKIVDKLNKTYFTSSFNYINEMFGADLDYFMLQDLLTGNFIAYNSEQKYKEDEDSTYYFLSSVGKRKLKRAFERDKNLKKEPYVFRYWINTGTFRPAQTIINNLNDTTSLEIKNKEFELVDSLIVPALMQIKAADAKAEMKFEIKYSKSKVNEKIDFPFNIPESYEKKE